MLSRRLSSVRAKFKCDDRDEPDEADELHGVEAEANRNHRVRLHTAGMHERLHYARGQYCYCECIDNTAADMRSVQCNDDRAKNRKVLDTVHVRSSSALIPTGAL